MLESRRKFIQKIASLSAYGLALTSGLIRPAFANHSWQVDKFKAGGYKKTLKMLYNGASFIESKKITFSKIPKVAENGAVVPIAISSTLEGAEKITLLVENNPQPLIAEFYLSPAVLPHVSARLKMAKTSNIIVIIEAKGKLYRKSQHVKVTKGGCGS